MLNITEIVDNINMEDSHIKMLAIATIKACYVAGTFGDDELLYAINYCKDPESRASLLNFYESKH